MQTCFICLDDVSTQTTIFELCGQWQYLKNVLVYFMPTIDAFKNGICIAESVLIVKMKYTLDISTIGSIMEYLYLIMVYILY